MSMTAPGNPELEGPVSSRCHLTASIIICVSLLLATGCGKGGGGGTETPILAPNGLSYTVPGPLLIGISITPLAPSYGGGAVSSWTCEPDLPEGLTFDSSDGVISGTPVELSPPTEYQITASNGSGSSTFFLELSVIVQPPCALGYADSNPIYQLGIGIFPNVPFYSCGTPTSWTVDPPLPLGLAIDGGTGLISGVPGELAAATEHLIQASNSTGIALTTVIIEVVPQPPCDLRYTVSATSYVVGEVIAPNQPLYGCGEPDGWNVDLALPLGIEIDPTTGVISGSPVEVSPETFYTVTAANSSGSDSTVISIAVLPEPPCQLTYPVDELVLDLGEELPPQIPLVGCGEVEGYLVEPPLPAGLSLDPVTGILSGVAGIEAPPALHLISAENVSGSTTFEILISVLATAPCDLEYPLASITHPMGVAIDPIVPVVGCGTPSSFTISPDLPSGLALDAVTGTIFGTPQFETAEVEYTIVGGNAIGSVETTILIRIADVFHLWGDPISASYDLATGEGVAETTIWLEEGSQNLSYPTPIAGFSFVLQHDSTLLVSTSIDQGDALISLNGGSGPDFWITNQLDGVIVVGMVVSIMFSDVLFTSTASEVSRVSYETVSANLQGNQGSVETTLIWGNPSMEPPIDNLVVMSTVPVTSVKPVLHDIPVVLVSSP